jgi:pimeloyl-ACP methyl ester carboxylesterase
MPDAYAGISNSTSIPKNIFVSSFNAWLDVGLMQTPSKLLFLPGALGRTEFWANYPGLPDWFTSYREDLTSSLSALRIPTLLLWGDADPISPVKVGRRLAAVLPQAELHVIPGGDHDVACTFAGRVAPLIDRHLSGTPVNRRSASG